MNNKATLGLDGLASLQIAVLGVVNTLASGVYAIPDDESDLETIKREFHSRISRNRFAPQDSGYVAYTHESEDGKNIMFGVVSSDDKVDDAYCVVTLPVGVVEVFVLPFFRLSTWVKAVLNLYPGAVDIKSRGPEVGFSIEEYDAARECFEKVLCQKSGCSPDHVSNHHGSGSKEGVGSAYYCYPSNQPVEVPDDELLFWYRAYQKDPINQPM